MSYTGSYYGQPLTTLKSLQVTFRDAIAACAVGQSYSINGRQKTMADLRDLERSLEAVTAEIIRQESGATPVSRVIYGDFSTSTV